MAVFTPLSREDVDGWLAGFDLGALESLTGIESGIENSNFFVTTGRGRFVLTLFERLSQSQLPFYLELMRHLAARDVPCPDPVPDRTGRILGSLAGKPAALVTRLGGRAHMNPLAEHCAQVGDLLARMHLGARDYTGDQPNLRGLPWWIETAPRVEPFLDRDARTLLADELREQQQFARAAAYRSLPRSAVHADLFRDNVLFEGDERSPRLGGVIDFYFAGVDTWMFDLAVTANDWCIDDVSGEFDPARLSALLRAYSARRPFLAIEHDAWAPMLRAAALRFWLSRLYDLHLPRPAEIVTPKDPLHFERILRARRTRVATIAETEACR